MPFHCTQALLGNGSIILPGNYGRIVRALGQSHAAALRESVLEHVRVQSFPEMPSRFEAAFFCETLAQIQAYITNNNLQFLNVYEVAKTDEDAAEALTDFRMLSPWGPADFSWATRYWSGQPHPQHAAIWPGLPAETFFERFSASPLRILQRIPL
ncbi:DUF2441 domain-containing protein [Agrobacterium pusense]|uniref:DUF2441 domain-containing protein n=1 Tax=Agrobacterium pusense TaxID=648995 RepID=A0AA44ERZ8_9HYPH|nr:DUF2441 domain-containing protein [Agrobacterium pusense]NRF23330.1 DUF2441 domain-containing protein [Agrobacterium pusense]